MVNKQNTIFQLHMEQTAFDCLTIRRINEGVRGKIHTTEVVFQSRSFYLVQFFWFMDAHRHFKDYTQRLEITKSDHRKKQTPKMKINIRAFPDSLQLQFRTSREKNYHKGCS